ncbi:MAG: CIA30 family protein [Pseudomonadota bacterium]
MADLIADFEDGRTGWRVITDQVMGGVSSGRFEIRREGAQAFLELTGTVSTANNGGFIQARYDLPDTWPAGARALRLRVRGDGQVYYIHLKLHGAQRPWHYYQASFDAGPDWREIVLPLAAFVPSREGLPRHFAPETVVSLAVVAYGRDHEAHVAVSRIEVE